MHSGRSSEAADICGVLRETVDAVRGLRSITVSTVEGNELLAVASPRVEGDAAAAGVNRDRAAVFAGAAEQLLKLGQGGVQVTTAYYSNQVAMLVLASPLIVSVVGDLDAEGLDMPTVRKLAEPLRKLVEPLRESVVEVS
jgi:hypothetical protein